MASPPGEVPIGIQKVRAVPLRVLWRVPRVTEPPVFIQPVGWLMRRAFPLNQGEMPPLEVSGSGYQYLFDIGTT